MRPQGVEEHGTPALLSLLKGKGTPVGPNPNWGAAIKMLKRSNLTPDCRFDPPLIRASQVDSWTSSDRLIGDRWGLPRSASTCSHGFRPVIITAKRRDRPSTEPKSRSGTEPPNRTRGSRSMVTDSLMARESQLLPTARRIVEGRFVRPGWLAVSNTARAGACANESGGDTVP